MRYRSLVLLLIVGVLAASCGGADAGPEPDVVHRGAESERTVLAYAYSPGSDLAYEIGAAIDMSMTMDAPDMPLGASMGNMEMGLDLSAIVDYEIDEGTEPGTYAITFRYRDFQFSNPRGFMDGQALSDAELAAIAADPSFSAALPEATVVVDEQGRVLSMEFGGQSVPADLFGGSGLGMSGLGGVGGAGNMLGPSFPTEGIGLSDSWSTEETMAIPMFGDVTISQTHTVVRDEEIDGNRTMVVVTRTEMPGISATMDDLLEDMKDLGPAAGLSGDDVEEMMDMMPDFDLTFDIAPSSSTTTTWFLPDEGITTRIDGATTMTMTMAMSGPPELGGDMTIHMDMLLDLSVRLVDSGTPA